jgi:predicted RNA binding protein YcfA (HicA-like mRNA interferase family)
VRLPRDLSGNDLCKALVRMGYQQVRQRGSHVTLATRPAAGGEHHVTVPLHNPLRLGTLNSILRDLAEVHRLTRDELLKRLFGG